MSVQCSEGEIFPGKLITRIERTADMVETKRTERLSEVKCISWYTHQAETSQKHGTY